MATYSNLPKGIVPRVLLESEERLEGEVFAVELLKRPIKMTSIETKKGEKLVVTIDRSNVELAVISSHGKTEACNKIHPLLKSGRIDKVMQYDIMLHNKMLKPILKDNISDQVWENEIMPLRWASGGVLPIITIKNYGNKTFWIPFFFRDIRPVGWNIPLGATERMFSKDGKYQYNLESELNHPWKASSREYLEETLILDGDPHDYNALQYRPITMPDNTIQTEEFAASMVEMRLRLDGLIIERSPCQIISNGIYDTNVRLIVKDGDGKLSITDNVLIIFSLLDLGIEVIRVIDIEIEDFEPYFLDGEILNSNPPELTRMPVALMSLEYLKRVFGGENVIQTSNFTKGIQPSFRAAELPNEDEIKFYSWDFERRKMIFENRCTGVGTESQRYQHWVDTFCNVDISYFNTQYSNLFTPASAKAINLYFNKRMDQL